MEEKELVSSRTDKYTWLEKKRKVYKKEANAKAPDFALQVRDTVMYWPTTNSSQCHRADQRNRFSWYDWHTTISVGVMDLMGLKRKKNLIF
jgi:hypothetical protein